jgi:TRAP-type mannitol/chloroaromatic compound transport system permease small subunit
VSDLRQEQAAVDAFDALLQAAPADRPRGLIERAALGLGVIGAWLFLVAILLSVYEVVMRYLFGAPSSWALPTTTTLCQIGFALGGAYCMARGQHIRVSSLPARLGAARQRGFDLLALGIGAFYLAGLAYAVFLDARLAVWKFGFDGRWAPELTPGPPNWPLPAIGKSALVAGAALFLAVTIVQLLRLIRRREA